MSPYEIVHAGASVEHWNEEAGGAWLQRVMDIYTSAVWLNPTPERFWTHSGSTDLIKQIFNDRMFPLTLDGLDAAMRELSR